MSDPQVNAPRKAGPQKFWLPRHFTKVVAVGALITSGLTAYDTLRNKGGLFVCDLLTLAGRAEMLEDCSDKAGGPPDLKNPRLIDFKPPAPAVAVPRAVRILEGNSETPQRRIFDITLENPAAVQIVLNSFELRWRYLPGALAGVTQAAVIAPQVAHSLEMTVDTSDTSEQARSWPVSPTIVMPAGSPAAPSIHVFRLELTYAFADPAQYHATDDWNLAFTLKVMALPDHLISIFADERWR